VASFCSLFLLYSTMIHFLRALVLGVSLVLTLYTARVAFAEKNWQQVRTQRFSVITDIGEKRALEIANRCEQMRAAFTLLMDHASSSDPAPLLIFALNGQNEVDEMLSGRGAKSRHAGIFVSGADQNFILIDASQGSLPTSLHEYAHELLNANSSANMQTWFEEGFAEYFSTFEVRAGKFSVGRVPLRELAFLRSNGKLMRLADLIAVDQSSKIYNQNGPEQNLFYAESWLLVHYLFDHQLIARAQPFFALMASGIALGDAIQQSFGMSAQKLESELLNYGRGEKFRYFSLPVPQDFSTRAAKVTALSAMTMAALRNEVRWHGIASHSQEEAQRYADAYKSLLQREPGNPYALRGLGLAMLELHDYNSSLEYLKEAVAADPNELANDRALHLLWDAAPQLRADASGGK
jgi:Protein of unknown function (DUF1570)